MSTYRAMEAIIVSYWMGVILMGIFLIFGVIGNITIILYFGFRCSNKTSYRLYITLPCVTDFVTCFLALIFDWTPLFLKEWIFGHFMCRYGYPLVQLAEFSSCWILVGMALERYRGIVHPFKSSIKKKHVYIYCFLVWTASFVLYFPLFMRPNSKDNTSVPINSCFELLKSH